MVLSLKLELKSNNSHVLVTNLETTEQIEVTFNFVQKIVKSSLNMLIQDKYYEIIIDAKKHWENIKIFEPGLEDEIIKNIKLNEIENIAKIRSGVKEQVRRETAEKQEKWKEVAAYNKTQRELREEKQHQYKKKLLEEKQRKIENSVYYNVQNQYIDDMSICHQSQQSYNRALIALDYANYCLIHDYRYNYQEDIDQNTIPQLNLEYLLEKELISLIKENQALLKKIAELEGRYAITENVFVAGEADCIFCEVLE